MNDVRRIIIAITGASGSTLGIRLLEILRDTPDVETHLVMSPSAVRTLQIKTDYPVEKVIALADKTHSFKDVGASIASGSFLHDGMIVAPCSVNTLSAIAHCLSDDLIARAADACLKERRRLVLMSGKHRCTRATSTSWTAPRAMAPSSCRRSSASTTVHNRAWTSSTTWPAVHSTSSASTRERLPVGRASRAATAMRSKSRKNND